LKKSKIHGMLVLLNMLPKSDNITAIIGITGMPGAKKTDVAKILSNYGIPYFTLSSILFQELAKRKLEPTPPNYAKLASELRKKFGQDFLAKQAWKSVTSKVTIIDGIRSPKEVDFLRNAADYFFLVLVHASPETRFRRFKQSKNPFLSTREQFDAQEKDNLKIGVGEVSVQADYVIINESYCRKSLKDQVDALYRFLQNKVPGIEARGGQN